MCPLAGTIDAEIHRVWLLGPPAAVAAADAAVLPWLSALDERNRCLVMNTARATGSCVCVCDRVVAVAAVDVDSYGWSSTTCDWNVAWCLE